MSRLLSGGLLLACALSAGGSNLVTESPAWQQWSPREELKPLMSVEDSGAVSITARKFSDYGKWTRLITGIRPGQTYRFAVSYLPGQIASEDTSVVAILSWYRDAAGKQMLQRDYADTGDREGHWRKLQRTVAAPEGAVSVRLELALRWTEHGSVTWKDAELSEVPAVSRRMVRLVTTHLVPQAPHTVESNLRQMSELIDRAAASRPDLIVLSENVVDRGVRESLLKTSQPVPGPATEMMSQKARQHRTYISTSLHEIEDGKVYNTAVLIDRNGRIVGKYRKVHLAMEEGERGITPGSEYPVFETDFGKVGMLTCWDNWFVETARILRLNGAELLILPIAGDGVPGHWDVISRARAIDNGVFLISSNTVGDSTSRIVSPEGKVLAETIEPAGLAFAEVDMDEVHRVHWLSVGPGKGDPRSLYLKERRPETYKSFAPAASGTSITTKFEGGSGNVEKLSDTHFRCQIAGEEDQDKRNHQSSWFYFRIDGVRGRELTVDLTGFRGEYNYKPTDGGWAAKLRPAVSFDDKNWSFVQDATFSAEGPQLRLKIKPEGDSVWIARIPPYVNRHLAALLKEVAKHPHLKQESAGTTPEGRPMTLLTITDPSAPMTEKKVVWLMTRQHSWEAGSSWVGEGAIRFLLSDTADAKQIRQKFVFKIFPMCDPDGVARGGVRFNKYGFDLNRNWDTIEQKRMPEIYAQHKAMIDWLDSGKSIDFFMTVHNTESQDYIDGPVTAGGPAVGAMIRKLSAELASRTAFHSPGGPRDMRSSTTPGMKGRMSVNQGLFRERKVPALLMELMTERSPKLGHEPTIQDRLDFGAGLVQSIAAALN